MPPTSRAPDAKEATRPPQQQPQHLGKPPRPFFEATLNTTSSRQAQAPTNPLLPCPEAPAPCTKLRQTPKVWRDQPRNFPSPGRQQKVPRKGHPRASHAHAAENLMAARGKLLPPPLPLPTEQCNMTDSSAATRRHCYPLGAGDNTPREGGGAQVAQHKAGLGSIPLSLLGGSIRRGAASRAAGALTPAPSRGTLVTLGIPLGRADGRCSKRWSFCPAAGQRRSSVFGLHSGRSDLFSTQ